jgi:hypothetical protein
MFIDASVSPAKASRSASGRLIGQRPPNKGNGIAYTFLPATAFLPATRVCLAHSFAAQAFDMSRNSLSHC